MDRKAFSVAVFVRRASSVPQILVIKHKRLNTWLPIGGEMEAGETPLQAAKRELHEETGLSGRFERLEDHHDGVPCGFLGYEEHQAGSKGMHLNFVFVCDVDADAKVIPNDEYDDYRWIKREDVESIDAPLNVKEFGLDALKVRSFKNANT